MRGPRAWPCTFFRAGSIAGRLLAVRASRRFSPARLVVLCGGGLALFSIGLALAPGVVVSMILAVGAGLGASASFGLIGSYSSRFPAWHAGVVSSAYLLAAGAGSMVFPYLIGRLASAAGFRVAISLLPFPPVLYALLALVVRARSGEASEAREIAAIAPQDSPAGQAVLISEQGGGGCRKKVIKRLRGLSSHERAPARANASMNRPASESHSCSECDRRYHPIV